MSMSYLSLIVVTMVIGMGASWYVNRQINKYLHVPASTRVTGAQMAEMMLAANGVHGVQVYRGGPQQDHFDPRNNSITLDPDAFGGTSITAIATACHEAGHAIQFAQGYAPMKIRGALVPAVNFASNAWVFLLMFGIFMQLSGLTGHAAGRVRCVASRPCVSQDPGHLAGRAGRGVFRAARLRAHLRCRRLDVHPAAAVAAAVP